MCDIPIEYSECKVQKFRSLDDLIQSRSLLNLIIKQKHYYRKYTCQDGWTVFVNGAKMCDDRHSIEYSINIMYIEDEYTYFWRCTLRPVYRDIFSKCYLPNDRWTYVIIDHETISLCDLPIGEDSLQSYNKKIERLLTFA